MPARPAISADVLFSLPRASWPARALRLPRGATRWTSEPAAPRHCSLLAHAARHHRRCACFLARRWTSAEKTGSLWGPDWRRSRARREWRRARDLCSRARRSQWHGIPGSKALNSELLLLLPPLRSPRQLGAAVLAAAVAAAASRLASVTAALHLAAARPSDGAGASLTGASPPPPPFSRRSARGRRLPCQSRRLPCHPAARTTAATASRLAAAATDRPLPYAAVR